jgi:hypothetical protein
MPFEIIWQPTVVYKRFFGFVTATELLMSMRALQQDHRFANLAYAINDFTDVESYVVSDADVAKFSEHGHGASQDNPAVSIAIVTNNEQIKALVQRYAAPYRVAYFSTVAQAYAWALPTTAPVNTTP